MRITSLNPFLFCAAVALGACGGTAAPAGTGPAAHPGHHAAPTPAESVQPAQGATEHHEHGTEMAHGGPEEPHEHDFPGAVNDFHDVMAPIWHSEDKAPCPQKDAFLAKANDIEQMKAPRGVQVGQWQEATRTLRAKVEAMTRDCATDPAGASTRLADVHDAFHALVALIGHEEHEGR